MMKLCIVTVVAFFNTGDYTLTAFDEKVNADGAWDACKAMSIAQATSVKQDFGAYFAYPSFVVSNDGDRQFSGADIFLGHAAVKQGEPSS